MVSSIIALLLVPVVLLVVGKAIKAADQLYYFTKNESEEEAQKEIERAKVILIFRMLMVLVGILAVFMGIQALYQIYISLK